MNKRNTRTSTKKDLLTSFFIFWAGASHRAIRSQSWLLALLGILEDVGLQPRISTAIPPAVLGLW